MSGFLIILIANSLLLTIGCQPDNQSNNITSEGKRKNVKKVNVTHSVETSSKNISRKSTARTSEHRGEVQRNDSFYKILNRLGVSTRRIYELTNNYEQALNQFQLKPGQEYYYEVHETDTTQEIQQFTWLPSPRDVVEINFKDSISLKVRRKSINTKLSSAEGRIESSLYETFQDRGIPITLAFKLSELFAWQIDFFLLREGDAFKMIYAEQYIDGEKIGVGKVLAAKFRHRGNTFHAYRFYNGKEMGYYDLKGESLQKALLKAPLQFRYISSGYSHDRYHPILQRRMPHYGIDYVAPRGTPVVSVGDGKVIKAGYKGANGNMIKIRHNSTYSTTYIHLSRFSNGIRKGVDVEQGEVIGYVGSTGRSTGSHLDYRLYENGHPVNPRTIDLPPTKSIDSTYIKAFRYASQQMSKKLGEMDFSQTRDNPGSVTQSTEVSSDEDAAEKSS